MSFIPHTEEETRDMLAAIGVQQIRDLFDEIPSDLKHAELSTIPAAVTEMQLFSEMQKATNKKVTDLCFLGGGAYEHHIPSAVWDIVSRGEFLTAYTPYQAEVSQGTLQVLYEFQTMMARLTALDVSNASLYEGATAVLEAVLMCVRQRRGKKTHPIWVLGALNPNYQSVLETLVDREGITLKFIPFDANSGTTPKETLDATLGATEEEPAVLVIQQPNFFGQLEAVDELTDWAHAQAAQVVACVNPTAMALLKPPGEWGQKGADVACGEGQPLGVPLAGGGPYLGFITAKQSYIRQMPGRIVGRTLDSNGKKGFCLTLQAREQHIRRSKATSNICTAQSLLAIAATIYMSIMGPEGLRRVALSSHQNTQALKKKLLSIPGIQTTFKGDCFHECLVTLPAPAALVIEKMSLLGIQAGLDAHSLSSACSDRTLLFCVTETKSEADLLHYQRTLIAVLDELEGVKS